MALIDFHCHLDLYPNPREVAAEAARRGVYVLSVTTTPSAFKGTQTLEGPEGRIRTALGLHPEIAVARSHELSLFEELLPSTDYVGEVGLDGSRDHRATLDRQGEILSRILDLCAKSGGKTISLHSRSATRLLLDVLSSEPLAGQTVLHWFSGSDREIERAASMGCWFSVGWPMLQSAKGRNCVLGMPLDRILPETDGPFGLRDQKPLLPWQAVDVYDELATLHRATRTEIENILTANFRTLTSLSTRRISDVVP